MLSFGSAVNNASVWASFQNSGLLTKSQPCISQTASGSAAAIPPYTASAIALIKTGSSLGGDISMKVSDA
ncbi:MAG: hypothetical protein BWX80_02990 [Candidatus Hydrogenedentes bacterium ADurb.Bin101]|nr:MAG: hypothetical protein BWX80_02990 [Candidatus Hydrogenedentes bacterium ADurb.Bin101]